MINRIYREKILMKDQWKYRRTKKFSCVIIKLSNHIRPMIIIKWWSIAAYIYIYIYIYGFTCCTVPLDRTIGDLQHNLDNFLRRQVFLRKSRDFGRWRKQYHWFNLMHLRSDFHELRNLIPSSSSPYPSMACPVNLKSHQAQRNPRSKLFMFEIKQNPERKK